MARHSLVSSFAIESFYIGQCVQYLKSVWFRLFNNSFSRHIDFCNQFKFWLILLLKHLIFNLYFNIKTLQVQLADKNMIGILIIYKLADLSVNQILPRISLFKFHEGVPSCLVLNFHWQTKKVIQKPKTLLWVRGLFNLYSVSFFGWYFNCFKKIFR